MLKKINLKIVKNIKGDVVKIIDKNNKSFKGFGEIYFSKIKKPYIKGWNLHKRLYCQIILCYGEIELKLKSKGKIKVITLSKVRNKLLIIPPKTWFAIKSKSKESMILNILSGVHDPKETKKKQIN